MPASTGNRAGVSEPEGMQVSTLPALGPGPEILAKLILALLPVLLRARRCFCFGFCFLLRLVSRRLPVLPLISFLAGFLFVFVRVVADEVVVLDGGIVD